MGAQGRQQDGEADAAAGGSPGKPTQATITPSLPAPPPARLSPELEEALVAARRHTAGLTVPDHLPRPHPIVAGWIRERRTRREDARRWHAGGPLPADFTVIERRRHRILSTLFIAVEKHGCTAKVDDRGRTFLEIDGEPAVPLSRRNSARCAGR